MKLLLLIFTLLATAAAQTPEPARTLTIRLFSTHTIQSLTITPLSPSATQRDCPSCPRHPVSAPFDLTPIHPIYLEGIFRLTAEGQTASAAGQWSISPSSHGAEVLLTLPSERYVAAALNGETASDEPAESLRAMAIVVRTFALANPRRHATYHLCDSTHCQALRFGPLRPEIEQAVLDTAGETLWTSTGQRASPYFTQNCGGASEAVENVWPTTPKPWLTSHPDAFCIRRGPIQWQAQLTLDQLTTLARSEHWHLPGNIHAIRILRRTPSGRASLLEIEGTGPPAHLSASTLHFALDRTFGWNQLRSDWYTLTLANGVLHFSGRGYGHGVGLCQAGARQMALEHHTTAEILAQYFPTTHAGVNPSDHGWTETPAHAWTLRTLHPDPTLIQQGERAWTQALALFPTPNPPHPTVYAIPSTELFRQTTTQPGWTQASARTNHIFLNRTPAPETLLHEFLHVLIESESNPHTPVWLREGLVEALLHPGPAAIALSPAAIEAALTSAPDAPSARRAHTQAGQLVTQLLQRHGLSTLRNWLRTGTTTP